MEMLYKEHDDIIIGNFSDTYDHLPLKVKLKNKCSKIIRSLANKTVAINDRPQQNVSQANCTENNNVAC